MNPRLRLLLIRIGIVIGIAFAVGMATMEVISTRNELAAGAGEAKSAP
jgi:hypothetical protein